MNENAEYAAQVASAAKWGGATAAVTGTITLNEWLGICGLIIAVIGTVANLWINFFYKRKEDRREVERHEAIKAGWSVKDGT